MFLLRVLRCTAPLPWLSEDLSGVLLEIVRDETPRQGAKWFALDAYIHTRQDSREEAGELRKLLADVHEGRVSDPDRELRGKLLSRLYPEWLPPSEVWDYLREMPETKLVGSHGRFWNRDLLDNSSDEQVAELLDSLTGRLPGLRPALGPRLEDLPAKLLARGLKAHGGRLGPGRLYDWLSVVFAGNEYGRYGYQVSGEEAVREVRAWLEQRPASLKAALLEGLDRCPESDEFRGHAFQVHKCLYRADWPPGFGLWCLERAASLAEAKPLAAEHLFELAVHRRRAEGLSHGLLEEHAQKNETLKATLDRLRAPGLADSPEYLEMERKYTEEQEQEEQQWLEYVRANEEALRENRAPPALLHELARTYFEDFNRDFDGFSGADGEKAIAEQLRGDPGLTDAALQSLRGTIDREDIQTPGRSSP